MILTREGWVQEAGQFTEPLRGCFLSKRRRHYHGWRVFPHAACFQAETRTPKMVTNKTKRNTRSRAIWEFVSQTGFAVTSTPLPKNCYGFSRKLLKNQGNDYNRTTSGQNFSLKTQIIESILSK